MAYKDKEKKREATREYYYQHKDEISKRAAEYYQKNKERLSEYSHKWYTENKDRVIANATRNQKKANDKTRETAYNTHKRWSLDEIDMVRKLKGEGVTNREIAELLGRSIKSINGAVNKLYKQGIFVKEQNSEAMEELLDLIELYYINSNLGGN